MATIFLYKIKNHSLRHQYRSNSNRKSNYCKITLSPFGSSGLVHIPSSLDLLLPIGSTRRSPSSHDNLVQSFTFPRTQPNTATSLSHRWTAERISVSVCNILCIIIYTVKHTHRAAISFHKVYERINAISFWTFDHLASIKYSEHLALPGKVIRRHYCKRFISTKYKCGALIREYYRVISTKTTRKPSSIVRIIHFGRKSISAEYRVVTSSSVTIKACSYQRINRPNHNLVVVAAPHQKNYPNNRVKSSGRHENPTNRRSSSIAQIIHSGRKSISHPRFTPKQFCYDRVSLSVNTKIFVYQRINRPNHNFVSVASTFQEKYSNELVISAVRYEKHPSQQLAKVMSRTPFSLRLFNSKVNSTLKEEDIPPEILERIDSVEPIESSVEPIEVDEELVGEVTDSNELEIELGVSERDINDISAIAASIEITEEEKFTFAKRERELSTTASSQNTQPPAKKLKRTMMSPPEADDVPMRPAKYVVRLVPDIEDIHLFSKAHGSIIHNSVKMQLKKVNDPDVKFDFCDFERGRYKFVCPNQNAKEWAMNVVPKLTDLWKDPKIKAIDCGEVPRLVRATAIVDNPAPETLEFFDDIEFKNESIDTNNWRPFNKKRIQGDRTIFFFGIDEVSVKDLKAIGFKPYFANSRIKITIEEDKRDK